MTNKKELDKCPKAYIKWVFVVVGMVVGFVVYIIYSNITGNDVYLDENMQEAGIQNFVQASMVQTAGAIEASSGPSCFLGLEIIPIDPVIAEEMDVKTKAGVFVSNVIPGSPAEKAGLKRADIIVALDNRTVKDTNRFKEIMSELNAGDSVRIVYVRDGRKDSIYARLIEPPSLSDTVRTVKQDGADWGVSLSPLSLPLRDLYNIPDDVNGVIILSVTPGETAFEAGLARGEVITGVDKTPVEDMDDFFGAIQSDRDTTALLDVYSQGAMRYVPVDSSGIKVVEQPQVRTPLQERTFSVFTGGVSFEDDNLVLTEHINEEDDYDKPVCKRLEESGERYSESEKGYDGEI